MNTLLSIADRFSRLNAVDSLVNRIADRILPHSTAKACSGSCTNMNHCMGYGHLRCIVYGDWYGYWCVLNLCRVEVVDLSCP